MVSFTKALHDKLEEELKGTSDKREKMDFSNFNFSYDGWSPFTNNSNFSQWFPSTNNSSEKTLEVLGLSLASMEDKVTRAAKVWLKLGVQ